jgi:hypothetical protein
MAKIISPSELHVNAEIHEQNIARYIELERLYETIATCEKRIIKVQMEIFENELKNK